MRWRAWAGAAALVLLAGSPGSPAGRRAHRAPRKEIVVDYQAGVVYPLVNGRLAHAPMITDDGEELKERYLGTFFISEKVVNKRSNLFDRHGEPITAEDPDAVGALMRYWMRLSGTAQGFHLSTLWAANGGRHISGGCYRLSQTDATWLFGWAPIGTPVHVYRSVCDSPYSRFCRLDRAPGMAPPHPPQFPIGQGQIHPPMLLPWSPAPHPPQVLLPTPETVTPPMTPAPEPVAPEPPVAVPPPPAVVSPTVPPPAPPHAGRRDGHAPRTVVARIAAFFGALRRALS